MEDCEVNIRDFKTLVSGLLDLSDRMFRRGAGRSQEDVAALKLAQTRLIDAYKPFGVKVCRNGDLFVPNKLKKEFDGRVFYEHGKMMTAMAISYVDRDDKNRVVGICAYKVQTERGLCWFLDLTDVGSGSLKKCRHSDIKAFGKILIKDHAIRRAMERSPIKDYDNALGLVIWTILKGKMFLRDAIKARFPDAGGDVLDCRIAPFMASLYGRVVGTKVVIADREYFRRHGIVLHLASTYLDLDMIPSWVHDGVVPQEYMEV